MAGRWCIPVSRRSEMDVGTEDLFDGDPDAYREEFLYAVEVARAQHDPATDWDGFRDTLWVYLTRVFGVEDPAAEPAVLPPADDGPGGDPHAVAGVVRGPDEGDQRSAATPRE